MLIHSLRIVKKCLIHAIRPFGVHGFVHAQKKVQPQFRNVIYNTQPTTRGSPVSQLECESISFSTESLRLKNTVHGELKCNWRKYLKTWRNIQAHPLPPDQFSLVARSLYAKRFITSFNNFLVGWKLHEDASHIHFTYSQPSLLKNLSILRNWCVINYSVGSVVSGSTVPSNMLVSPNFTLQQKKTRLQRFTINHCKSCTAMLYK